MSGTLVVGLALVCLLIALAAALALRSGIASYVMSVGL